jgi:hypothetical protein
MLLAESDRGSRLAEAGGLEGDLVEIEDCVLHIVRFKHDLPL